jgi:23S rRNA (cytidine1920-2'-O)/16S rRNA (cytidine1409-2'-O)-methyltransferase
MSKDKKRLDVHLVDAGLVESRARAQALIMAGEVTINGQIADKAGTLVGPDALVELRARPRFVSRGGEKLQAALDAFNYDPAGKLAADVGASTGGFTDCLLQAGIARVYAIDVGYGLLAQRVRDDARVVVIERTNARYLQTLPEPVDLIVIDASFISLKILLPVVVKWLKPVGDVIALIKPQFEAGKSDIGKGGVVRDQKVHRRVVYDVLSAAEQLGLSTHGVIPSPLKGPAGNTEYLAWLALERLTTVTIDDYMNRLFLT